VAISQLHGADYPGAGRHLSMKLPPDVSRVFLSLLVALIGTACNVVAAAQQPAPCDPPDPLTPGMRALLESHHPGVTAPPRLGAVAPPSLARIVPPGPRPIPEQLPAPDSLDDILRCVPDNQHLEIPHSAWRDNDGKRAGAVLTKTHADTLVVPVQVQAYGMDPIERSVMGADLARALSANAIVADPFLVDRAFGMGRRRIAISEAEELARRIGASRIITTFVGHDLRHSMVVSIQVKDLVPDGGQAHDQWQKDWRSIAFTDEDPPAFVFHRMLPEILAVLPAPTARGVTASPSMPTQTAPAVRTALDPAQLGDGKYSAEKVLTILGTLSGSRDSDIGSRLFARALVASLANADGGARDKWLQAFILMNLERRPAALARITGDIDPSSAALRALLDGDLPDSKAGLAKVTDPLQRFLLSVAAHDLELSYGQQPSVTPKATAAVFGKAYADWAPLVSMRSLDRDPWKVAPALAIKVMLDAAFPVPDLAAQTVLEGSTVTHRHLPDDIEVDRISFRHLERVAEEMAAPRCCAEPNLESTGWEMLSLFQSLLESRIGKAQYLETRLQNDPVDALRGLDRYEPMLEGHPVIVLARANAAIELLLASSGDVKEGWEARAQRAAELAAYLPQGQSPLSWEAMSDMTSPATGLGLYLAQAYSHDYPHHSYWHASSKSRYPAAEQRDLDLEELANSREDMWPLQDLAHLTPAAEMKVLIDGLGDRFQGQPDRERLLASLGGSPAPPPPDDTLARLREPVDRGVADFQSYLQLADAEIRTGGQYEAASRDLLRYPGFHIAKPADPVAESNFAEMAGTRLYALGQPELAKPLYQISARLHTGSEASLLSDLRLHILAGDYAGALAASRDRALSYNDAHAYRDYLSLLHVFGFGTEAWQGFTQVAAGSDDPQIWISALVGQRHEAATDAAMRSWLLQPHLRDAHFDGRRFAPYFAMIWYTTDRTPPEDAGDFINQLEWPGGARISADGFHVERPSLSNPDVPQVLDWSGLHVGTPERLPPGTPVRSEYAMFMDGYAALRRGQFPEALHSFIAMAGRYSIETTGTGNWPTYALPYMAYAAAQSGDPTGVENFVNQLQYGPAFDRWLAKAFFAGMHKDVGAAEAALNAAFREKLFAVLGQGSTRPVLVDYQYAEACEWLFQLTGDQRFIATLIDWVKRYQRIQPGYAWAYAMEYQYTADAKNRIRALALTLYLDPLSERITHASKADRLAAKRWLEENNPFVVHKSKPETSL
jgi:hypothetical protein